MIKVNFYQEVDDALLEFAVIVSKSQGKWVFCRHRDRQTYEFPGGHREPGETIEAAARRELYEETGAKSYSLWQAGVYSVEEGGGHGRRESFGMLYYAEIHCFDPLPGYEIERIELMDTLPHNWTYPHIQPWLLDRIEVFLEELPNSLD